MKLAAHYSNLTNRPSRTKRSYIKLWDQGNNNRTLPIQMNNGSLVSSSSENSTLSVRLNDWKQIGHSLQENNELIFATETTNSLERSRPKDPAPGQYIGDRQPFAIAQSTSEVHLGYVLRNANPHQQKTIAHLKTRQASSTGELIHSNLESASTPRKLVNSKRARAALGAIEAFWKATTSLDRSGRLLLGLIQTGITQIIENKTFDTSSLEIYLDALQHLAQPHRKHLTEEILTRLLYEGRILAPSQPRVSILYFHDGMVVEVTAESVVVKLLNAPDKRYFQIPIRASNILLLQALITEGQRIFYAEAKSGSMNVGAFVFGGGPVKTNSEHIELYREVTTWTR